LKAYLRDTSEAFHVRPRALSGLALADAFRKLDPRVQWRNPVMFVVYVGAILTTLLWFQALAGRGEAPGWFILNVAIWLWFTLLFANLAEALAEGRSKAQAASLRGLKQTVMAKKLAHPEDRARTERRAGERSAPRRCRAGRGRRLHTGRW
jgi:K+-transporting ATPase ATPase B chain